MKQLYDVSYVAKNQPLEHAEKVLKHETIVYIRQTEEISVHGCYVLDRWASYEPTELKQLEEQGDLILLNRLYQQQQTELDILNNSDYAKNEEHLTIHERLALHEIKTNLCL